MKDYKIVALGILLLLLGFFLVSYKIRQTPWTQEQYIRNSANSLFYRGDEYQKAGYISYEERYVVNSFLF